MVESRLGISSEEGVLQEARDFFTPKAETPHIEPVAIPEELHEVQRILKEKGFQFEHIFYPAVIFTPKLELRGWNTKPGKWYWDQIRKGELPKDAATLIGVHALIETIQRPSYDGGKQLYSNDPLAEKLAALSAEGAIMIPDWCTHIPERSRFGLSADEVDRYIAPHVAHATDGVIDVSQVGTPRSIEFNYAGNLRYPEFGKTNTWEWFADKFGGGYRLIGGSSDDGGLADVYYYRSFIHNDSIGFRLQVVFPSK